MPLSYSAAPNDWAKNTWSACYEAVFIKVARLRSGRGWTNDWRVFRAAVLHDIEQADAEVRRLPSDFQTDADDAKYAVVSFVDTMVMTSEIEDFEDWQIKTLQHELFGMGKGGVDFFVRLDKALKRPDSQATANLLELYLVCLELGFEGRASAAELVGLRPVIEAKVRRTRRHGAAMSPGWRPSARSIVIRFDDSPLHRAAAIALATGGAAGVLYVIFWFLLSHGAARFSAVVTGS